MAISDFTKAIEFNNKWGIGSNLSVGYYSRARTYHAIKTDDEDKRRELLNLSLADWNKTLEIKPNQPEGYYGRGLVYIDLEDFTSALYDFKKAYDTTTEIDYKSIYIERLVQCYISLGEPDEFKNLMLQDKGDNALLEVEIPETNKIN